MNAKSFYKIILIGGGHSNIQVIKSWAMNPPKNAKLILISDQANAPYSGMLPLYIKGEYTFDEVHFDLRRICALAHVDFIESKVTKIDPEKKIILLENRPSVSYDYASINTGIIPLESFLDYSKEKDEKRVVFLKPISKLIYKFEIILQEITKSNKTLHLAMIGGGAAGIEMTFMIQARLQDLNKNCNLSLFHNTKELLKGHHVRSQELIVQNLQKSGIKIYLNTEINSFKDNTLTSNNNETYPCDFLFVSTHAMAPSWPKESGLSVCSEGFIKVDNFLNVINSPSLFAAGDCIQFSNFKLNKAGVYAVRQGPILKHNLRHVIGEEKSFIPYKPQKSILGLIHSGVDDVIYSKGRFVHSGKRYYKLKKYIDKKFMENFGLPFYHLLPKSMTGVKYLEASEINTCGGCGSKVSPDLLFGIIHSPLFDIYKDVLPEVLDDAPSFPTDKGKISTSIDGFRSFINDPYLFGKVATLHALSDLAANGARPLNVNLSITLKIAPEKLQQYELKQMMFGICEILSKHKVKIIKGHSSEGLESNITISVNGISPDKNYTKFLIKQGDQLILTKGLGAGILLRALMLGECEGRWCSSFLKSLQQDNLDIIPLLDQYNISAMTDITGFGFVGHLLEMLNQNKFSVELNYSKIKLFKGVESILDKGIQSHLGPKLKKLYLKKIENLNNFNIDSLHDPQTNGGLLIAIQKDQAETLKNALRKIGHVDSEIIGQIISAKKNKIYLK